MDRRVHLAVAALVALAGCLGATGGADTQTTPADGTQGTLSGVGEQWTVTLVRVVDGDTLEVRFPDGHTENVRLLGVDTPEVRATNDPQEFEGIPDTEAGKTHLKEWGNRASEFARARLSGELTIAVDPEADRRGSFGRLLVYVYEDGEMFNEALLREGYARVYESSFSKLDAFQQLEVTARENRVGLWEYGEATPTTVERGLVVATIRADAEGDDNQNRNGEYVVLRNADDQPLNLTGWTVADAAGHVYRFPAGFELGPGERVTIYSGAGTDTATELYWNADGAIWNNDGDVVTVTDDEGDVVTRYEYG